MMFEAGADYIITAGIGDEIGYSSYRVISYEAPLLKVEGAGIESIFNTSSPFFVKAERKVRP